MIKLIFITSLLISLFSLSASIIANCNFYSAKFTFVGTIYHCEITNDLNIISPNSIEIDDVTGTHEAGKTNDDVFGLKIDNKTTHYFPTRFEKMFKNLKVLMIANSGLKEIHAHDLQFFPELAVLSVYGNDIEILEKGLFDNNRNLNGVWFFNNKILYVDYFVFENLPKLSYIDLLNNLCIDKIGSYSKNAVQAVIDTARKDCQNEDYYLALIRLRKLEEDSKSLNTENFEKFRTSFKDFELFFNSSGLAQYQFLKVRVDNLIKLIDEWIQRIQSQQRNTRIREPLEEKEVDQCQNICDKNAQFDSQIEELMRFFLKALEFRKNNCK